MFRTRFAPSPTGPLHLGHAFSAMLAHDMAMAADGQFLLRIEDIDQTRARPEWEQQIHDDLGWLGLNWPSPVLRQSDRSEAYRDALLSLWSRGLLYPCTCRRRDIEAAVAAPQEGAGPLVGPDGIVYPGTCRTASRVGRLPTEAALRLDMAQALAICGPLDFLETGAGPDGETGRIEISEEWALAGIGDFVVARRDMGTSYHLSVVVDDAYQDITHVVRGRDLFEATAIHVILQRLLGLPTPIYHHHRLIRDEAGKRLAKRDDARAIARYREDGLSPDDIREMVDLPNSGLRSSAP